VDSRIPGKDARAWLVVAAIVTVLVLPVNASAGVLYEQTGSPNAGCTSSSDFGIPNKVAQGADDFTVPAGATWQLSSVDVFGGGALTGSPTAAVFLYGAGSLPGSQFFSQSGIPIAGFNDFSIPITGAPPLTAGTYWISVQITDPVQWAWCAEQAQFGAAAAWRNPGDGFSKGCITYTPLTSCGNLGKSFLFRLNAPDPVAPAPVTGATKKKCKNKKYRRHHRKKCRKRKRR
jgi:hypothetical protein